MSTTKLSPALSQTLSPLVRRAVLIATALMVAILLGYVMRGDGNDYRNPAWALWIHLATVIPAVPLGAWVLWGPKGTPGHKAAGRIWASMMLVTAIDSFWLRSLTGGVGPIHIFSILTLYSIPVSIWNARRGNIGAHRRAMVGVYAGLFVAGGFTMIPGRYLPNLLFG